jgi:hypothetical protein
MDWDRDSRQCDPVPWADGSHVASVLANTGQIVIHPDDGTIMLGSPVVRYAGPVRRTKGTVYHCEMGFWCVDVAHMWDCAYERTPVARVIDSVLTTKAVADLVREYLYFGGVDVPYATVLTEHLRGECGKDSHFKDTSGIEWLVWTYVDDGARIPEEDRRFPIAGLLPPTYLPTDQPTYRPT